MPPVLLPEMPKLGRLYRKAALRRASHSTLSDRALALAAVRVDVAQLAAYNRVCGFRLSDTLPATYPHVLAFPLAMSLMTDASFPFPLLGLVHLSNHISMRQPLPVSGVYDLSVQAVDLRPHERGSLVDVVATASVSSTVVWTGHSTYLHRSGGRGVSHKSEISDKPVASAVWRVPRRTGTDYARASGDRNPIHTNRLLARALGFRSTIAHGMWTKARCLAALDGRLPATFDVDVTFKTPILLPATVAFSATQDADADRWALAVHAEKTGKPHLIGAITPVAA